MWARELFMVEKMLEVDARNCKLRRPPSELISIDQNNVYTVHAWNYRRYVLSSLPASFKPAKTAFTELKYTTKKIESNFSNFSAWHQRTKVLGKLWDEMEGEDGEREKRKMKEEGGYWSLRHRSFPF